jgi:hypothetical protein
LCFSIRKSYRNSNVLPVSIISTQILSIYIRIHNKFNKNVLLKISAVRTTNMRRE